MWHSNCWSIKEVLLNGTGQISIWSKVPHPNISKGGDRMSPQSHWNKGTIKTCSFKQGTTVCIKCSISRVTHYKYPLGDYFFPEIIFSFQLLHLIFHHLLTHLMSKAGFSCFSRAAGCCQNHMMVSMAKASQLLTTSRKTARVWEGRGH